MTRVCDCGCGESLEGLRRKRFVDDAHRMRANRTRTGSEREPNIQAEPEQEPGQAIQAVAELGIVTEPGRLRGGLESFFVDHGDLPQPLVEAARVLADQLEHAPGHSPLWARYLDTLRQLTDATDEITSEGLELLYDLRTACEHPAEHARSQVIHCGMCCETFKAVHAL